MVVKCHICNKAMHEGMRMVAYGEVNAIFYDEPFGNGWIDDIEPVNGWNVVHYHCFYKEE